ncbi:MAG: 3-oxoacyl-ACP synthase III [Lentisphaeraceae bacterium]|nr:3-oxoacyl-ACP synthase III [Lentisphaeraceae bacterium]
MLYNNVCIEGFEAHLPPNSITSEEIENQLSDVYEKLRLPPGRLEMFSGIKARKYWELGTKPSDVSTQAAQNLLERLNIDPSEIDALIHCSVCRDFLEPATASVVHSNLKLPKHALNFDISNACLGMLSGVGVLADMISSGRIKRGLLVAGEIGYPLLNRTIQHLKDDKTLTRKSIKPHFASLTIGSAATAIIVSHESVLKNDGHEINCISDYAYTEHNHLCQGTADSGMGKDSAPLMETDSEVLLEKGIEAAGQCWTKFLEECQWRSDDVDRCITHQVGSAHSKLLYKTVKIDASQDFTTYPFMGNCGSASLPLTVALAEQENHIIKGHKVALLGIGSGINCSMISLKW